MDEASIKADLERPDENIVDRAHRAADRIEKANAELASLLARQEKIMAQQIISGKAEAGKPRVERTEEDKTKEEANNFLKGTGLKI